MAVASELIVGRCAVVAGLNRCRGGQSLALVAALMLLGLVSAPRAAAATNVSGTLSADTVWTAAGSPYVMVGNVTVDAGVTLTVEPGVVVQGNAQARTLFVSGSLSASGTAAQPITFTSTADAGPGEWSGITFQSAAGASLLGHVHVRNGGGAGVSHANGMVAASGGTLTVDDSTFSSSSVSGLALYGGVSGTDVSAVVRRSKFESNGYVGGALHGDGLYSLNARVVVRDSAFWSNAGDGLNFTVASGYTPSASDIAGSSITRNRRYGTGAHAAFEAEVNALGRSDLATEVSYLAGRVVPRGTAGSVRLDVIEGLLTSPTAIYDLKTGSAALTARRIAQIRGHLPPGYRNIPVREVRP